MIINGLESDGEWGEKEKRVECSAWSVRYEREREKGEEGEKEWDDEEEEMEDMRVS